MTQLYRPVVWILLALLGANQYLLWSLAPEARGASAHGIYATKLNPDGKTTTVALWPTITEVSKEPRGTDLVEAAKTVMIARGTPFYAPQGITFDDPVGALAAWQGYEAAITLPPDLDARHKRIIGMMTCDYCCGSPGSVTIINRCGCQHAQAYRSIAKYLLQKYGTKYSDEEILGELQRWKGLWYPKGVVEDYLLATGRGAALGHATHGGAGADGRHGL